MPLTPGSLPRHELVGLHVRVVESTDPSRVGIEGTVVRETMGTLLIEGQDAGVRQIPKRGSTFEFVIDEAAADREAAGTASEPAERGGVASATTSGGDDAAYVTVDGEALCSRPARRSENGVDSQWR